MSAEISIIIPVLNEVDNILPLASETIAAMRHQALSYEIVFVDDASTDLTWERIREAHRLAPAVRGLRHQHNAGQSAAVWTGVQSTRAPIIATLDGDRQNDPADLPHLLSHLDSVDFVSGMRLNREDNWIRRLSSRVSLWARRRVLKSDFQDTGCGIRVYKRTAIEGLLPFNGMHRFLPMLVHAHGVKTLEVPVNHRQRVAGISKYGVWNRLGRGIYDLIGVRWYLRRSLRPVPFIALEPARPMTHYADAARGPGAS